MMWTKYQPVWVADGVGSSGGGDGGTGGSGAAGAVAGVGGGAGTGTSPWYGDKIDATTLGYWQNKGIDTKDPVAVASKLTEFYRNAEGRLGAPPEELIRIPKPNAAEADINIYWQRIGVPAEAKDYDLSGVKFADGSELDTAFADMMREAMRESRVPKDRATNIVSRIVKHMESNDAAELAEKTAHIKNEQDALKRNWGTNEAYNKGIAERALQDIGRASGLTPEQTKQGWDALSTVGGIGASYAMEMLRTIGAKMGEAPFIGSQPGQGGDNKVMSRDQAKAEIESLKSDKNFYKQLTQGSVEAKRRWSDLHKIAFAA